MVKPPLGRGHETHSFIHKMSSTLNASCVLAFEIGKGGHLMVE